MLWLWFNPVKVSFLVLLCIAWPILICLSEKGEKFSNVALGNSQPFCPPCRHPFFKIFFTIQSFLLFIHPLFSDFSCRLKGFRALSGIRSPKTGFGCSFIAAPLSLLLFFCLSSLHSDFTSMYLFFILLLFRSSMLVPKSSDGMEWVFFFVMQAWIMGGEALWSSPQGKGNPIKQLTQRAVHKTFFKELKWSLLFTKSVLQSFG